jgi:hypothetical protein
MMKINRITSIIFAAITLVTVPAISHAKTSDCQTYIGFSENYNDMDPFITIDFKASINKLPEEEKTKAQALYNQLTEFENNITEDELSIEEETRINILYSRLDNIFMSSNVDHVEIDLLKNLSDADQLKALILWRKISNKKCADNIDESFVELDELLSAN